MNDAGRPVVIWDVDDVLNELMREWFDAFALARKPRVEGFTGLHRNPPHELLGLSQAEYLASLDSFRASRYAALTPRSEVLAWFRQHGRGADHVVLSAVPQAFAHVSAAWVFAHFGEWVRTFSFVPSPRPGSDEAPVTKRQYLQWLGKGDILVEDRQENADDAAGLGLATVVVPQPWNRSPHATLTDALTRVRTLM